MTAKPSVGGNKDKDKDTLASPEVLGQVHEIMITGDLNKLKNYGIDDVDEFLAEVDKRTHMSVERAKSPLRRAVNKVRNSTFGALAEIGGVAFIAGAGTYLTYCAVDGYFKNRDSKRMAMLANQPIGDTILEDA